MCPVCTLWTRPSRGHCRTLHAMIQIPNRARKKSNSHFRIKEETLRRNQAFTKHSQKHIIHETRQRKSFMLERDGGIFEKNLIFTCKCLNMTRAANVLLAFLVIFFSFMKNNSVRVCRTQICYKDLIARPYQIEPIEGNEIKDSQPNIVLYII